jgi:hypothetical protein
MIFYLARRPHLSALTRVIRDWGRALGPETALVAYEDLARRRRFPAGTVIFADLERLSPPLTETAGFVRSSLARECPACRLLNHPLRSLRRFELLRRLYELGINDFDVYRVTEARRPARFPVFLREESEHGQIVPRLLRGEEELDAAIDELTEEGLCRDDKLIVEFADGADDSGTYHRYGAFVIGKKIVPSSLDFSTSWVTRNSHPAERFATPQHLEAEDRYLRENPHRDLLLRIAGLAKIDYGRIDYAFHDGRIRVFEINTNPEIPCEQDFRGLNGSPARYHASRRPALELSTRNMLRTLAELNSVEAVRSQVRVAYPWDRKTLRARRCKGLIEAGLRAAGANAAQEVAIVDALRRTRRMIGRLRPAGRAALKCRGETV